MLTCSPFPSLSPAPSPLCPSPSLPPPLHFFLSLCPPNPKTPQAPTLTSGTCPVFAVGDVTHCGYGRIMVADNMAKACVKNVLKVVANKPMTKVYNTTKKPFLPVLAALGRTNGVASIPWVNKWLARKVYLSLFPSPPLDLTPSFPPSLPPSLPPSSSPPRLSRSLSRALCRSLSLARPCPPPALLSLSTQAARKNFTWQFPHKHINSF